jgi:hypothetical protein
VQQNYRQGANDQQVQLAEDWAAALANGSTAANIENSTKVEISTSLSPFIMVFDASEKVVASSAMLHAAQITKLPDGVLAYAKEHTDNRLTWEPSSDSRSAAVIKYYKSMGGEGYVLVGRSLREVELREKKLLQMTGLLWIVGMVGIIALHTFTKEKRV